MDEQNSKLLAELNNLMTAVKGDAFLSQLPPSSWQASYVISNGILTVYILKNDSMLMDNDWYEYTDPTTWLRMFVPPTSKLLARNKTMLAPNLKVFFNVKSESEIWIANCSVSVLIEGVQNGKINEFGPMMALLDLDVKKNE